MSDRPALGVCYYPEHWPREMWAQDAARMADLGLSLVRIGEFAWSRIEPARGDFRWDWLDEAIGLLGDSELKVILGTPTATPPKWLIDERPDILAHDEQDRPRRFGSRRHYCFSSPAWREETVRIVEAVARRYGAHPAVAAWQTDNEYGCHSTVRSYSPAAARAFRLWLAARYGDVDALNAAWGTVFWSQEYRRFDEIDPPHLTVTEANPSHRLDFFRFSSEAVRNYNRLQADIIRRYAPGRPVLHNFMGFFTEFDAFAVGEDLDLSTWDSYPIGFLDVGPFPAADKARWRRQGHPDIAGFHHDLYRGCSRGRFAVIEQQPGPVNWAPHNPAPLPGMARLWAHEGLAHGAEFVSYFRWRQAPFAQEQMHAGLLRPDDAPAPAFEEARRVADEIAGDAAPLAASAPVALVYSFETAWMSEIQPQGAAWSYPALTLAWYGAARRLGLDVDIVPPGRALDGYALILVPALFHVDEAALAAFSTAGGVTLFGPRSGSKTRDFQIPPTLPPGPLQSLLPLRVTHSESLPADHVETVAFGDGEFPAGLWLDHVETGLEPAARIKGGPMEGAGALYAAGRRRLLTIAPGEAFLDALIESLAAEAGLEPLRLPPDLRIRRRGVETFAFNYGTAPLDLPAPLADGARFRLGGPRLPPAGVAAWRAGDCNPA